MTTPLLEGGPGPGADPRRRLGIVQLSVIGFFCVSGGVYGSEALVSAAPPLMMCTFTLSVAVFFALPNALMTAEMATAFPADGGAVAWVRAAFGPTLGLHHAVWVIVTSLLDAAVYPQLAALYLTRGFSVNGWLAEQGIVIGFILAVGAMNLCGLDVVAASQTVAFVVSLVPCLAFTAIGLPSLDLEVVLSMEGRTDWALLLSWALWLYSGFSSLGSMAGEVARPQRTYPVVVALLLPLVTLLNLLPFVVALSLDPVA